MNVYKAKIQFDGSIHKLKLRNVVRGYLQNRKYLLADANKHKARVHQLYFIRAFLQEKVNNRVFVKLESRYADYFPEYSN